MSSQATSWHHVYMPEGRSGQFISGWWCLSHYCFLDNIYCCQKMLKRREECDTYLTHVCRHCWSKEGLVKRWNIQSFQQTLRHSSAVERDWHKASRAAKGIVGMGRNRVRFSRCLYQVGHLKLVGTQVVAETCKDWIRLDKGIAVEMEDFICFLL